MTFINHVKTTTNDISEPSHVVTEVEGLQERRRKRRAPCKIHAPLLNWERQHTQPRPQSIIQYY